ncbi:hypothetical protein DM02DRAFT_727989 [Periconia macrospinosa]|uniref:Uncharacterized protein n=1 Tax=Periconia macrospinosa TaxID=97972 RepID=A0A2V1DWM9_9PLEO|nr:hypothetical protein DM02DRAFT_727989 [Periconia macrospinosa]
MDFPRRARRQATIDKTRAAFEDIWTDELYESSSAIPRRRAIPMPTETVMDYDFQDGPTLFKNDGNLNPVYAKKRLAVRHTHQQAMGDEEGPVGGESRNRRRLVIDEDDLESHDRRTSVTDEEGDLDPNNRRTSVIDEEGGLEPHNRRTSVIDEEPHNRRSSVIDEGSGQASFNAQRYTTPQNQMGPVSRRPSMRGGMPLGRRQRMAPEEARLGTRVLVSQASRHPYPSSVEESVGSYPRPRDFSVLDEIETPDLSSDLPMGSTPASHWRGSILSNPAISSGHIETRDMPTQTDNVLPVEEETGPAPIIVRHGGHFRYADALEDSLLAVIVLAWQHALSVNPGFAMDTDRQEWVFLGVAILASIPLTMLKLFVGHNLAAALRGGYVGRFDTLRAHMEPEGAWMQQGQGDAPVIYVVSLVSRDALGSGPTVQQLREVVRLLLEYIEGKASAIVVDNAIRSPKGRETLALDIQAGTQKYLCKTKDGRRVPSANRREVIRIFANALGERLALEDDETRHIHPPLQYVGYAFNFAKREAQHQTGESNYLMHLVNSICQVLYPATFNLEAHPICYLAEEKEVPFAELLLSLVTNTFYTTGRGFNIATPGLSNASADMKYVMHGEAVEFWKARQAFRDSQPWRREAMQRLQAGIQNPVEQLEAAERERAALKDELKNLE